MIRTGYSYYANFVKKTKTGKTMFSVQDYDKANPTAEKKYATVFCDDSVELYDKCKVKFIEITGISLGEYKGKLQASIFAKVVLDGEQVKSDVDKHLSDMAGNTNVVQSDDLPF